MRFYEMFNIVNQGFDIRQFDRVRKEKFLLHALENILDRVMEVRSNLYFTDKFEANVFLHMLAQRLGLFEKFANTDYEERKQIPQFNYPLTRLIFLRDGDDDISHYLRSAFDHATTWFNTHMAGPNFLRSFEQIEYANAFEAIIRARASLDGGNNPGKRQEALTGYRKVASQIASNLTHDTPSVRMFMKSMLEELRQGEITHLNIHIDEFAEKEPEAYLQLLQWLLHHGITKELHSDIDTTPVAKAMMQHRKQLIRLFSYFV